MKRTKIVCTIGPASNKLATMKAMIRAGMNVARLNFSHGTYADHMALIRTIRRASRETGIPVAILQDLQGPRIRLGQLPKEGVILKKGMRVVMVPEARHVKSQISNLKSSVLPQQYAGLARDVQKGTTILIADGAMELVVEKIVGDAIHAVVKQGGLAKSHKGLNVPGVMLGAAAMTKKDRADLDFGIAQGVDFATLSFVKSARDMHALRKRIAARTPRGHVAPRIVAKVERPEAVDAIEAIARASDAIMLGRGDLALEGDQAKLAVMQERVVETCLRLGVPVIVATQMLESMMENTRPTRAELSDVAHAVMDHADATMLSGETAGGKYPVEVVRTMASVIHETEESKYDNLPDGYFGAPDNGLDALARAVHGLVCESGIRAVIVRETALPVFPRIARLRPETLLVPVFSNRDHARPYLLTWGAYPFIARVSLSDTALVRHLRAVYHLGPSHPLVVVHSIPRPNHSIDQCFTII